MRIAGRLLRCIGIREFAQFESRYIGHLAIEPDLYWKEVHLGMRRPVQGPWVTGLTSRTNRHLLWYWREYRGQRIVTFRPFVSLLKRLGRAEVLPRTDMSIVPPDDQSSYRFIEAQNAWGDRPPLLKLTDRDRERGYSVLHRLGLPSGAWFVCFHARESGFNLKHDRAAGLHEHRNVDIGTYHLAANEVRKRGGWVIRVGDETMKPCEFGEQFIDYARSPLRSDWMDIFLLAKCRFLLGCDSGPASVANVFGTPVVWTNMIPLSNCLPYSRCDVTLPKLYRSVRTGEMIPFSEILGSAIGNYRMSSQYAGVADRIEIIDNTPEEIRDAAVDLLRILEGEKGLLEEAAELMERFRSMFRPGHLSYGLEKGGMAPSFLKRHAGLVR